MLRIKRYINQQDFKIVDLHFVTSESFSLTQSGGWGSNFKWVKMPIK